MIRVWKYQSKFNINLSPSLMIQMGREVPMKQIFEEGKPYTSSLNFCPEACCRKGWVWAEKHTHPLTTTLFPSWSMDISFKDVVTFILLLDDSFIRVPLHSQSASESFRHRLKYGVRSPKLIWAPVYSCTHWLRPCNSPPPPHLG